MRSEELQIFYYVKECENKVYKKIQKNLDKETLILTIFIIVKI